MSSENSKSGNQTLKNRHITLLELLDRVIDKGVVAKGEVMLSVADIDLIYLNLGLLLSSVKTVERAARRGGSRWLHQPPPSGKSYLGELPAEEEEAITLPSQNELLSATESSDKEEQPLHEQASQESNEELSASAVQLLPDQDERSRPPAAKTSIDHKSVEQGLAKLVLTLIDLLRKLMEKQAIRRIEDNQLSDQEIEELGNTFFLLNERMEELKKIFHLENEDLNLDLGPLGELL
jgi:hypothetical protein